MTFLIRCSRIAGWLVLLLAGSAIAQPGAERSEGPFELRDRLALGIAEHRLDGQTEVTGWRLNRSWYLGYRDGDGDGLSLVWQGRRQQLSISTEEVRFTRRF